MNARPWLIPLACALVAGALVAGAAIAETRVGVGILLALDPTDSVPCVVNIIPDSPADRAGLPKNALIRKINGTPTAGLTLEECIAKLRGPDGIPVLLEFTDPATGKDRKMMIVRGKFEAAD